MPTINIELYNTEIMRASSLKETLLDAWEKLEPVTPEKRPISEARIEAWHQDYLGYKNRLVFLRDVLQRHNLEMSPPRMIKGVDPIAISERNIQSQLQMSPPVSDVRTMTPVSIALTNLEKGEAIFKDLKAFIVRQSEQNQSMLVTIATNQQQLPPEDRKRIIGGGVSSIKALTELNRHLQEDYPVYITSLLNVQLKTLSNQADKTVLMEQFQASHPDIRFSATPAAAAAASSSSSPQKSTAQLTGLQEQISEKMRLRDLAVAAMKDCAVKLGASSRAEQKMSDHEISGLKIALVSHRNSSMQLDKEIKELQQRLQPAESHSIATASRLNSESVRALREVEQPDPVPLHPHPPRP